VSSAHRRRGRSNGAEAPLRRTTYFADDFGAVSQGNRTLSRALALSCTRQARSRTQRTFQQQHGYYGNTSAPDDRVSACGRSCTKGTRTSSNGPSPRKLSTMRWKSIGRVCFPRRRSPTLFAMRMNQSSRCRAKYRRSETRESLFARRVAATSEPMATTS